MYQILLTQSKLKYLSHQTKILYKYLNQNKMFRKAFRFLFLNYCRLHLYIFAPIVRMVR